jgi:protein-S-isoprenylcysteine O-methyltransferase Ste14
MIIMMAWLFTLPSPNLFTKTPATNITGAVITLAGFTVMSLCIYKYFFQLSGLKSLVENRVNNELMITGIHKHVRHPLYSGTFVFIWGLLILIPTWSVLIADAIITIYTLIGLRFEEQKLVREFGEKYLEYKRQVPMILPRIL